MTRPKVGRRTLRVSPRCTDSVLQRHMRQLSGGLAILGLWLCQTLSAQSTIGWIGFLKNGEVWLQGQRRP
jgi:hypothetical protein